MSHFRTYACSVALAGLVVVRAVAAPVGATPDPSAPGAGPAAGASAAANLLAPSSLPDAGTSKTVDLLVELQSRQQGLPSDEALRKPSGAARRATLGSGDARSALTPEAPQFGGLLGDAAAHPAANRPAALDYSGGGTGAAGGYARAGDPALSGWLAWPREFIAFIREHRLAVLATAAAVLALLWLRPGMGGSKRR